MNLRQTARAIAGASLLCALMITLAGAQVRTRDGSIFRWTGTDWVQVPGFGVRISVGSEGPWVVNANGEIFRWVNDAFQKVPGQARDIGVGNGSAWVIGNGNNVYRWNGRDWDQVNGNGIAISVERFGMPWLVDRNGNILYWRNNGFVRMPGTASDIGAGTGVWVIGNDRRVYRLVNDAFMPVGGGSVARVSAGAQGTAWVVNDQGNIYKYENGQFQQVPGWASDIGANERGEVWVIGEPDRTLRGNPARRARPR